MREKELKNMTKLDGRIKKITPIIQQLVNQEFLKINYKPESESALAQFNLVDGDKVVYDYINHNEYEIAFEHLLYMINETGIKLDDETSSEIIELAKILKVDFSGKNIHHE